MIKAIIFDLDETLVNRRATMENFLAQQFEKFRDQLSVTMHIYIQENLEAQNNGYTDKLEAYSLFCSTHGIGKGFAKELYEDYLNHYGHEAQLFENAYKTLESVAQEYTLAMITNGKTLCQNRKINSTGIRPFFKTIKISQEEGIPKPDLRIFKNCLADLQFQPQECLFIGDHPENDITPASKLGMKTVWVKNDKYPAPTHCDSTVNSITELPSFL